VGGWKECIVNKALQILLIALCTSSAAIAATTIDFDTLAGWSEYTNLEPLKYDDVTFYAYGGDVVTAYSDWFTNNIGLQAWDDTEVYTPIMAVFEKAVSFVSVELGDGIGFDADDLFLRLYASEDTFITVTAHLASNEASKTLSWERTGTDPSIKWVVFGGVVPELYADVLNQQNSVVIADNFKYTVVPAPGALLLATIGLACVQGLRRRKLV